MSLETVAAVLAIWFFGSIPAALFIGRCLRALSATDGQPVLATLPHAWRHDERQVELAS